MGGNKSSCQQRHTQQQLRGGEWHAAEAREMAAGMAQGRAVRESFIWSKLARHERRGAGGKAAFAREGERRAHAGMAWHGREASSRPASHTTMLPGR